MSNVIQIRDEQGNALYPITDVSLIMGLENRTGMRVVPVDSLPTASADTVGVIYMVTSTKAISITKLVDGAYSWVSCGTLDNVDLSGYATTAELDQLGQEILDKETVYSETDVAKDMQHRINYGIVVGDEFQLTWDNATPGSTWIQLMTMTSGNAVVETLANINKVTTASGSVRVKITQPGATKFTIYLAGTNADITIEKVTNYLDELNEKIDSVESEVGAVDNIIEPKVVVYSEENVSVDTRHVTTFDISEGEVFELKWDNATPARTRIIWQTLDQSNATVESLYDATVSSVSGAIRITTTASAKIFNVYLTGATSDILIQRIDNRIDEVSDRVDAVESYINESLKSEHITNENFDSSIYETYGSASAQRGKLSFLLLDYNHFDLQINVSSNSPIQAAVQSVPYYYDTNWKGAGESLHVTKDDFPSASTGVTLVFSTISDESIVPTVDQIREYISFTLDLTKTTTLKGISERIGGLEKIIGRKLKYVAHRGVHINGIPENSIDAFINAGYAGYDFAETDITKTSDGHYVLMHDTTINRTMRNASDYSAISSDVLVTSKTLAELRANYVLASDDPRYRRPIPTLEEYFITCRESGVFPIPELLGTLNDADLLAIFNLGKEILGEGNFGFVSFYSPKLDYIRNLSQNTPLLYIGDSILGTGRNSKFDIWNPDYRNLTEEIVKSYHAAGQIVAAWTVPIEDFDSVVKMGVDIITFDWPCPVPTNGKWVSSRKNWNGFTNEGTVVENSVVLQAGQKLSYLAQDSIDFGGLYVSVIARGSFNIECSNSNTFSFENTEFERIQVQTLLGDQIPSFVITATAETTVQFVEIKAGTF